MYNSDQIGSANFFRKIFINLLGIFFGKYLVNFFGRFLLIFLEGSYYFFGRLSFFPKLLLIFVSNNIYDNIRNFLGIFSKNFLYDLFNEICLKKYYRFFR